EHQGELFRLPLDDRVRQPLFVPECAVKGRQRATGAADDLAQAGMAIALLQEYLGGGFQKAVNALLAALAQTHVRSHFRPGRCGHLAGIAGVVRGIGFDRSCHGRMIVANETAIPLVTGYGFRCGGMAGCWIVRAPLWRRHYGTRLMLPFMMAEWPGKLQKNEFGSAPSFFGSKLIEVLSPAPITLEWAITRVSPAFT